MAIEVELAEVVAAVVLRAVLVASEETPGTGGGPPAAGGGPSGGETLVMDVIEVVEDEDEVEEADDAADEDEEMMGAGGATGLLGGPPDSFGCALLEEGTLLEPEVIVPDEPATNVSRCVYQSFKRQTYSRRIQPQEDHQPGDQEHRSVLVLVQVLPQSLQS